ncbi:hypothetical protein HALLA_16985 [Halostagnicola larsenii XH-48]|uniref:DUF3311 domain-containing protein n=1 Tax=Halostagnicola larsenii XH-48 TaxID=797299 RepID=W0JT90_9EURY|nr:DUF3311 domain-containing protein [Halostagnicola larsenii]AHG00243.1 hypothetical protein HALLA_16985 [Halostagnicola larsenii XH-48]
MSRAELVGWGVLGLALAVFSIPWFLWGNETVVAGLPVWLWWHVGWMVLTAVVFWIFTERAWGIGIDADVGDPPDETRSHPSAGGRPESAPANEGDST